MKPPYVLPLNEGDDLFAILYEDGEPRWRPGTMIGWVNDHELLVSFDDGTTVAHRFHMHGVRSAAFCRLMTRAT